MLFDCETTGKANFKLPPTDNSQPRLVQLACQVFASNNIRPLHSFCYIVKPEGFEIPLEASNIHGITTDLATQVGVNINWLIKSFNGFLQTATLLVAHNAVFDVLIMNNELQRKGLEAIKVPIFCTMQVMTLICNLPGKFGKPKWPKLSEAYKYVTGKDPEHTHDALEDLKSTKVVFDYLHSSKTI